MGTKRKNSFAHGAFVCCYVRPQKWIKGPTLWTRFGLLIAFSALLLVILSGLVIVAKLSHSLNGYNLSPKMASHSYLWKYGPTALLTIIVALWRQVDRHTRLDQPWLEMSACVASAQKSVLLDYVSPLLPIAFWHSLRNKHWRVTTTMIVLALLKIIIAISTGLFILRDVQSTVSDVDIALQNPASSNVSDGAYWANEVSANMNGGLELRLGVATNAAFQALSTNNTFPIDATVTAEVYAAYPDLRCEEANLTVNITTGSTAVCPNGLLRCNFTTMSTYINSSSCSGEIPISKPSCIDFWNKTACQAEVYYFGGGHSWDCLGFDRPYDGLYKTNAYVFWMFAASPPSEPSAFVFKWASAAVCQTKYAVERADLTQRSKFIGSNEGITLSAPKTSTKNLLPNYTQWQLNSEVSGGTFIWHNTSIPASSLTADYSAVENYADFMLTYMKTSDVNVFRNVSVLIDSATHIYQRFASQLLAKRFHLLNSLSSKGSYTFAESKLFVLDTNAWIIGLLLSLATVSILGLALVSSKPKQFPQVRTLSQLATFCSRESAIAPILANTGHVSDNELRRCTLDHAYRTRLISQNRYHLNAELASTETTIKTIPVRKNEAVLSQFWIPFSANKWFILICVFIPVAEIVILEVLQQKSDAQSGFADLTSSLRVGQSMSTIIPAVVMLSTATLFSAAEWAIGVFTPWSLARKHPTPLKHLDKNETDGLAPVSIVRATSKKQYAVSIIVASTLLGGFLTPIVSGLYELKAVPSPLDVHVSTTSQFNTSWDLEDGGKVRDLFTLMLLHNASYPTGLYDNFAFPLMQLDNSSNSVREASSSATYIDVDLLVLRARLNCSTVPRELMSYGIKFDNDTLLVVASLEATVDLPKECQRSSGDYRNASQMIASYNFEYRPRIGEETSTYDQASVGLLIAPDSYEHKWPPYCPSLAFFIGTFTRDTRVDNKAILLCTQLQEETPATLRFNLPSFSLDTQKKPLLDETKRKTVSGYQYRFDELFGISVESFATSNTTNADQFYQTLMNITGLSLKSMINDTALLYNQTEMLYQRFMALTFSQAMRVSDPNTTMINWTWPTLPLRTSLNGTLSNQQHMRVFQNKAPKIALQAILAAMVLCLTAAYAMIDIKTTLPHNPSSIAGTLSLLVGSQFAECASTTELSNNDNEPGRRLRDRELRLRWWAGRDGNPPRFGLDLVTSPVHSVKTHNS